MGSTFNCCNYEKKDKKGSIEELNLEDTQNDFTKKRLDKTITLGTTEKGTDLSQSPKYINEFNKNAFALHMKKASESFKDEEYKNEANNIDPSKLPILKLYMTNVFSEEENNTKAIIITSKGYEDSERQEYDGHVYFGNLDDSNNQVDVMLPSNQLHDERA